MTNIIYKQESYEIVGACFKVYKDKECGFLEPVYQECLKIELERRSIKSTPQPSFPIHDKGRRLKQNYKPDFITFDSIVLEIKVVSRFNDEHRAQLFNYLQATGCRLGLLVNFGHRPKIEYERIVL